MITYTLKRDHLSNRAKFRSYILNVKNKELSRMNRSKKEKISGESRIEKLS